jgi:predicted NUDIX family phosphoesterase
MKQFNEFELLTLRECLFKCKDSTFEGVHLINKDEFNQIDLKIKKQLRGLDNETTNSIKGNAF